MLSFNEYDVISENKKHVGNFFDLDGTLLDTHDHIRVHVLNSAGQKVRTLSNKEYSNHVLPKDHSYDFSEFANSSVFGDTAKPIKRMMNILNTLKKNKQHAAIVTARGDMDNEDKFKHHMHKFGIDMNNTLVHRIGEQKGNISELKAKKIQDEIHKHGFEHVNFYDDDINNIQKFLKMQKQNPNTILSGHHVTFHADTGKTEIKHHKGQ